jgi:transcriptional regulator with XRE-family HTH domain
MQGVRRAICKTVAIAYTQTYNDFATGAVDCWGERASLLGEYLRAERHTRQWTQAEMARACGMSFGYYRQLEAGLRPNPGGKTLNRLAVGLGVSVDEVLRAAGITPPPRADLLAEGLPPEVVAELGRIWADLTPEDRERALGFWRWTLAQAHAKKPARDMQ